MQLRTVNGRTRWPLARMKIGQSFLVRDEKKWRTARVIASYYGGRNGRTYRVKKEAKGLRVKRVS